MSERKIVVTVDEESMGNLWHHVDEYCDTLRDALEEEFPDAEISVKPERRLVNGGKTEVYGWDDTYRWDAMKHCGGRESDRVLDRVSELMSEVYYRYEWAED